jgi:alpha-mannosidase
MKDLYPALYDQIRARVTEGRWECQGGTWVEMDTQLPAGESLVRQFLYGLRFFAEEFGQRPDYLFLPDCFGFSAALPQIIRKCGLHAFLTQKMSWNETNPFPHHTFTWEGIDGSRVLTHFLPTNDYNGSNLPDQLVEAERRYAQNDVSDDFMNLFGIGDGGGGPAESHIEYALRQTNLEGVPKMRIDSVQAFFRRLSHIPPERLPRWTGELYLELHRGTYTTQARMKRWNRRIEHALHDLELLAALWGGVDKPELDALWHDTLLHQFHDILPGSSIGWVYKDAEALSATNHTRIEELIRSILSRQFNTTDTSTTFVVLNTLGYPRTEYVELPATGIVRDSVGRALPSAERDGKTEALVSVPACGYTTITIDGEAESVPTVRFEPDVLENDLLRLEFGADGSITRIYDRESGREWLSGPANRFQLWEDLPNKWGAWDINHFYRDTVPEQARLLEAVTLPGNGLSAIRRQKLSVGKSIIEQEIRLVRGSRLIHCSLHIDWQETHRMLRVSAEPAVRAETAAYEIQFGTLHRPARANTSWDRARFEGVAHRFIDLSQPDAGFAVLNDGKYGHSVIDNRMEINILRSPADVDPTADMGLQELTFAYYPHAGTLSSSDTIAVAHALNAPLRFLPVQQAPDIPETSFFSLAGSGVKIETVKPAEDGKGVILRLYETFGGNAAVTLQTNTPWATLLETDLLEKPLDLQRPAGNSVELAFKPFEIRTFRLQYTDRS